MNNINFFVMDVDGTLTDGMIYVGSAGEMFKAFHVKDGCAIKEILPKYNIIPIVITARKSEIIKRRCEELGIKELHQGCRNKLEKLIEIMDRYSSIHAVQYNFNNVVYVGDDLLDVPVMREILAGGGQVACPGDAIYEIKQIANYISAYEAGKGAVRDIVEHVIENCCACSEIYNKRVKYALDYLSTIDLKNQKIGKYEVNDFFYYEIKQYETQEEANCTFESHRKYVDIQSVLRGSEIIKISTEANCKIKQKYNEIDDVTFFYDSGISTEVALMEDSYLVIPAGVLHKPCIQHNKKMVIKKLIGKIRIV